VALQRREVLVKNGTINIPVGRILRLLTKALRLSKDGLNRDERRELGLDLLEFASVLLEDMDLDQATK
jgi:hypothetical protein